MAELVYHVATDWQEVEKLFNEITKLNTALDKVNTDAPRVEVERLIGKISELKEKYNEIISVSQQANNDITQAFKDTSSSDNPLKGLGENADKAAKTLKDSFDSVIGKVCELYDYIEEVKKSINSLNGSSDIIGNMGNKMEALSAAVERQELSLSNQSTQNANILQQQQAELMAQNQQNTQMQSLNETASERVSIENEVASTIEDTTTIIEGQTEAVKEHTEAIKEQNEATQEVGDEFSDAVLSEERAITEKINSLKEFNSRIQESLANVTSQQEKENLEKQYSENEAQIQSLESQLENLTSVNEKTAESANAVFNIYKRFDEAGQPFRVMAQTAEEATEKIEFAKRILEIYPEVMKSISEKADDMRLNAYMTDEGEQLVKEAQRIVDKLSSKSGVSQMFGGNGENQGEQLLEQLQNIDSTLDNIKAKEQAIEQEREKSEELARIQAEEAEKRALSSQTMRTQMMKAREEMMQMIAAGKQGTIEFMELAQKAGEMRRQLAEANAYMQYLSTPQRGLAALKTGLQGVAGAASLVTSTIGLFNKDSKKMVEIQTKVQSILGIIVGLETTYNLVKKESFVRMALEEVRIWAIAKARGVEAAATTAAAGAQETLNKAMLKNPYGAIIALLVTLGTAIWAVTKALTSETDAEKKAREEKEEHIKAIKEQQEKWASSVAESASKQIDSYRKLQKKWNELGDDMSKKKKFIKENQTAFNNLGLSVSGVTDAENVLVQNTDAVVNAIMARAKALAYQELMTESLKKQIEDQLKADQKNASVEGGQFSYQVKAGGNAVDKKNKAYQNAFAAGYRYMEGDTEDGKWTEQGAKRLNQYSKNYAAQQRAKAAAEDKKRNKKYEDEQKKLLEKSEKELDEEKKKLSNKGIKTYNPNEETKDKGKGDSGKTAAEKAQEQRELMDKQKREQIRAAEDLEFSTREAQIKAMEESTEKTLAQIELDHDREVKAIERAYEDMRIKRVEAAKAVWEKDENNKGKNFFESQEYSDSLYNSDEETENLKARLDAAAKQRQQALKEESERQIQALRDSLKEYGDIQEQKLAIAEEYAEKIRKAEEAGNYVEAENLRQKEKQEVSAKEMARLKAEIDWEGLFNNLDLYSSDFLEGIRGKLQMALQDPSIETADKQIIAEKLAEIDKLVIEKTENTFSWINDYLKEQKRLKEEAARAAEDAKKAEEKLNEARSNQSNARQDIAEALAEITGVSGENLQGLLGKDVSKITSKDKESIFDNLGIDRLSKQGDILRAAFDKLAQAELRTAAATGKLETAEGKKKSADAKVEKDWRKRLAGVLGAFADDVNKYLSPLSSIADKLGLGDLSEKIDSGVNAVNSAAGAAASFATGDYLGAAMQGLDALSSFADTLGISFGGEESDKTYAEDMARLTETNQRLDESINRLNKTIQEGNIKEIGEAYEKQMRLWQIELKNLSEQVQRSLASYKSGGMFGSGEASSGYNVYTNLTAEEIKRLSEIFGIDINAEVQKRLDAQKENYERARNANPTKPYAIGFNDTINWASLQEGYKNLFGGNVISEILSNAKGDSYEDFLKSISVLRDDVEVWNKILALASEGHQDAEQYLTELADMGDKLREIEQGFVDSLSNISFDQMFNDYISNLDNLDEANKNFADTFEGYIRNAIIRGMAMEAAKPLLEKWQAALASYIKETNGKLTKEQINSLMHGGGTYTNINTGEEETFEGLDTINNSWKAIGETLKDLGLDKIDNSQQTATGKSISNISYTQADSLVGIATAQQIALEQSRDRLDMLNVKADQVYMVAIESRDIAADSRQILAGMAIHVEEIRDGMVDTLVPAIKDMRSDLAKVRKLVEEQ